MIASVITLKRVRVKLVGLSPLIFQGKGVMEADADGGGGKKGKHRPAIEEAALRAHWMGKGRKRQTCIPSMMFYKSFCQAALDFKQPQNKKKSMAYLVGATVSFEEDKIPLNEPYEVFEEWVLIPPRTGAAVKIGRPLWKKWSSEFTLLVDDEMWPVESLKEIITHAGKMVGIGAWRPGLKGSYGRYAIKEFSVLKG